MGQAEEQLTAPELLQQLARGVRELQLGQRNMHELLRDYLAGRAGGADAALIHAIHDGFGTREFSSSELLARGGWDDGQGRLLRALTLGMSKRNIGNRLAQLRGLPTASGLVVVQTSTNRDGAVWRVQAVQDSQPGA